MYLDNLAMVWAPNILRCSSDPSYLNVTKEMAYVRLLLQFLKTTDHPGEEAEGGEEACGDFEDSIANSFF